MIDERQVINRLVAVCPEFAPQWLTYLDSSEGVARGAYNDVSALAEWVVNRMAVGVLDCFATLFGEVESSLVGATTDVRNVIVIGLLEDIQNISKDHHVDPDILCASWGLNLGKSGFS